MFRLTVLLLGYLLLKGGGEGLILRHSQTAMLTFQSKKESFAQIYFGGFCGFLVKSQKWIPARNISVKINSLKNKKHTISSTFLEFHMYPHFLNTTQLEPTVDESYH